MVVTPAIRSSCEILNVATMAARFSFDDPVNFLDDSGPNNVFANASNYTQASGLRGGQAISFINTSLAYLQASGFRFFSFNNAPFSISLWVQPSTLRGVLTGSSLGYNPLVFASNGSLIARVNSVSIHTIPS